MSKLSVIEKYRLTAGYKFVGIALGVTGDDAYTDGSDRSYQKMSLETLMMLTTGGARIIWGILRRWEGSVRPPGLQLRSTHVRQSTWNTRRHMASIAVGGRLLRKGSIILNSHATDTESQIVYS